MILSEAVVSGEHVAALLPEEGAQGQSHSEEKTLEGNVRASDDADGGKEASSAQEASEAEKVGEHITNEDALQDSKKDGLNNGEM